jgi:hypothetical protein
MRVTAASPTTCVSNVCFEAFDQGQRLARHYCACSDAATALYNRLEVAVQNLQGNAHLKDKLTCAASALRLLRRELGEEIPGKWRPDYRRSKLRTVECYFELRVGDALAIVGWIKMPDGSFKRLDDNAIAPACPKCGRPQCSVHPEAASPSAPTPGATQPADDQQPDEMETGDDGEAVAEAASQTQTA